MNRALKTFFAIGLFTLTSGCALRVYWFGKDNSMTIVAWQECGPVDDHCVKAVKLLEAPNTNFEAALAELDVAEADPALKSDPENLSNVWWNRYVTLNASGDLRGAYEALVRSRDVAPEGSRERGRAEYGIERMKRRNPEMFPPAT